MEEEARRINEIMDALRRGMFFLFFFFPQSFYSQLLEKGKRVRFMGVIYFLPVNFVYLSSVMLELGQQRRQRGQRNQGNKCCVSSIALINNIDIVATYLAAC